MYESFSQDVKNEIASSHIKNKCCKKAFLRGMIFGTNAPDGSALYLESENPDFEMMMKEFAVQAGVKRVFSMLTEKFIYVKSGKSENRQMLFSFFPDKDSVCKLKLERDLSSTFTDLLSGEKIKAVNGILEFKSKHRNLAVLLEDA